MNIDLSVPIWTIEHVAAVLHLSVDTAREYTYRPDFPAAKVGFARNLWLCEEVLAWFAQLPARAADSTDQRPANTGTVATRAGKHSRRAATATSPISPAPASAGPPGQGLPAPEGGMSGAPKPPIDWVGHVAIYAPGSKGYYRLKWDEPDGRPGDTSGGRTLETARFEAAEIDARVSMAAGAFAVSPLEDLVTEYLAEATSPYSGEPWQRSYRNQVEDNLTRTIRRHERYRAMDVDRALCDTMRAQGGTRRMVIQNTTALRGFLLWGYRHRNQYFTAAQAELLPHGVVMPNPNILGTAMPKRRRRARAVGEHPDYVRKEDAPSRSQVIALGPRWGEQFQLTVHDAHLHGCAAEASPHLHLDWQIDPGADAADPAGRRTLPKGHKTRLAPVAELSFTGYRLREAL